MKKTEKQLWGTLQRALIASRVKGQAARFEVTTHVGVSDVEYVLAGWHGWIELKVSATVRDDSPLRFGHELTSEQCTWLLSHHAPARHLRSWLLIGLSGVNGWRGFVLLPAPATPRFLRLTSPPSLATLRVAGFGVHRTIDAVVHALTTSNGEGEKRCTKYW